MRHQPNPLKLQQQAGFLRGRKDERARQQLLLFALNPVIGVARPAGPWNGIEFNNQLYNFIFCPSQSYRGRDFDGGEKLK
eukprot:2529149-Pleurochrysis_carterae.AAC.1